MQAAVWLNYVAGAMVFVPYNTVFVASWKGFLHLDGELSVFRLPPAIQDMAPCHFPVEWLPFLSPIFVLHCFRDLREFFKDV